jgi:hypothetical protein
MVNLGDSLELTLEAIKGHNPFRENGIKFWE